MNLEYEEVVDWIREHIEERVHKFPEGMDPNNKQQMFAYKLGLFEAYCSICVRYGRIPSFTGDQVKINEIW